MSAQPLPGPKKSFEVGVQDLQDLDDRGAEGGVSAAAGQVGPTLALLFCREQPAALCLSWCDETIGWVPRAPTAPAGPILPIYSRATAAAPGEHRGRFPPSVAKGHVPRHRPSILRAGAERW